MNDDSKNDAVDASLVEDDAPEATANEPTCNTPGRPIVAWLIIVGIVLAIVLRPREVPEAERAGVQLIASRALEMQSKYLVGVASLNPQTSEELYQQTVASADRSTFDNHIRFAIVAGELAGQEEAATLLSEADAKWGLTATPEQKELLTLLSTLYVDHEMIGDPPLTPSQRQQVIDKLGWFGELALAPHGSDTAKRNSVIKSAQTLAIGLIAFILFGIALVLGGVVSAILLFALAFKKRLQSRVVGISRFRNVYVETFAVWILLHQTIGFVAAFFVTETNELLVSTVALACTGLAAAWPVLRGANWGSVRREIGLTAGSKSAIIEVLYGALGYVTMLPFIAVNMVMLALVMHFWKGGVGGDDGPQMPSHPIDEWATNGSTGTYILVFVIAAVVAPILEETMFRGFLYRHLRDNSRFLKTTTSVLMSAVFSSFVFAVIHPQGWLTVPALTTMAIGFCLIREWRGSLIASMTAHSLHNGLTTILMLLLVS
ncbi:MAG: CPBP family intramembrane metalloprotease [Planctomycetales bacterium]|nr:CPBP family intramembrane metalloprotease [Planctomycetales bacterium]